VKRHVCGLAIDREANEAGGPRITKLRSGPSAWMIPTDEDLIIACHTHGFLRGGSGN
jgi:acetate kinase